MLPSRMTVRQGQMSPYQSFPCNAAAALPNAAATIKRRVSSNDSGLMRATRGSGVSASPATQLLVKGGAMASRPLAQWTPRRSSWAPDQPATRG